MAVKELAVPDVGTVRFQKRRGTRSIRIHISGSDVRVTLPHWVTYREALLFVRKRAEWINDHLVDEIHIAEGSIIGKKHIVAVRPGTLRVRVTQDKVIVTKPPEQSLEDPVVKARLTKACERALAQECEQLIFPRLKDLAFEHGIEPQSIKTKKLKRRWGSCDRHRNIVLNIYLAQLPWECIDYVLLHELTHIEYFDHSRAFWSRLEELTPNAKQLRKTIKDYHPQLMPT